MVDGVHYDEAAHNRLGLAVGQAVTVTPEAPLDQPRQATIRVIDRVFDAATATFGLRMELQNTDLSLPAGLRCTLSFPES